MPFTLSHAAAVLPLRRQRWLNFPALVVGSLSPDVGYYFAPTEHFRENAHTLPMSFVFCVPVTLALLLALRGLREGIALLLPEGIGSAFRREMETLSFRKWIAAVLGALLGAWTHILWDSFTHRTGALVAEWPWLSLPAYAGVEWFRVLQHFSSAAGTICLLACLKKFYRPGTWGHGRLWLLWPSLVMVAAGWTSQELMGMASSRLWFYVVTGFGARLAFCVLLCALVFQLVSVKSRGAE